MKNTRFCCLQFKSDQGRQIKNNFENEEFLCFEVFRKHKVENDFIVTIAGVKYKKNKIIEMESLNENLDFDPSEGQDWNWEDYGDQVGRTTPSQKSRKSV